jgi:hypothetical protein
MSVVIATVTYDTYGDAAGIEEYANGSLLYADTFEAATATQAARALVEASRMLMAQVWIDDANGVTATAEAAVVAAAYELALIGLADPTVFTASTQSKNIKRLDAGDGVGVEFIGPVVIGRFPARVLDLIGALLDGSGLAAELGIGASTACGTSAPSDFDGCDPFDFSRG